MSFLIKKKKPENGFFLAFFEGILQIPVVFSGNFENSPFFWVENGKLRQTIVRKKSLTFSSGTDTMDIETVYKEEKNE